MVKLICLSGWKRTGKDTTAEYLVKEYGYEQLSFAKKLKDHVADKYKVDRDLLDSNTQKEMPLTNLPVITTDKFTQVIHNQLGTELKSGYWTPRALCILEGSTARSVYPNFWVRECAEIIMNNPDKKFVVSDMRYRSEADTMRVLVPQVTTIRIHRYVDIETQDPSERDLDNYSFDYILDNTRAIRDLYDQIDQLILKNGSTF